MSTSDRPIKTLHDKRLAFLVTLEQSYQEMGYTTKLNGRDNLLEVYEKGTVIPKTKVETIVENWIG